MAPRPYSALACLETLHGRVIIRSVFAKAQGQYVLVFDGDQKAIQLLLPAWRPKTTESRRTQVTPVKPITTELGISSYFQEIAPQLKKRIEAGGLAPAAQDTRIPAYRTLGELVEIIRSEVATTVRATSAATYSAQLTRILQLIPPTTLLYEISGDRLQVIVNDLVKAGTAGTTIRNLVVTLNKAMSRCMVDGVLRTNPLQRVKLPKAVRRPRPSISKHQRERLLEVAQKQGRDITLIIGLGSYAGLRKGEILGLRWEDLDLVHRVVRIRRSEVFEPKSGDRTIPLCSVLHGILLRFKRPSGYVVRPKATTLGPDRYVFRRLLHRVAVEAKLPWMSTHDLRRSFATCAAENGVNAFRLRRWLGHASIEQTAAYVLDEGYDDAIEGERLGESSVGYASVGVTVPRGRKIA